MTNADAWAAWLLAGFLVACSPEPWGRGTPTPATVPDEEIAQRAERQRTAAAALETPADKQILFGDLHVHTSFSPDGFITSLPLMGGEGAHPPSDACDFARFCSALDFWSINDHAEGITPRRWRETKQAIRECNAVVGAATGPDTVAFLGWEWSQVASSAQAHWGHKNVIFRETAEEAVPRRSIAAPRAQLGRSPVGPLARLGLLFADWENRDVYAQIPVYYEEIADTPRCEAGVDTRELPDECLEVAPDPATLFEKLDQWGFESIVIPHGNAWGLNTPPGTTFDKQLKARQHDPDRQILFELYSGHGSSEQTRAWRAVRQTPDGPVCPEPTDSFLPCCWRAGQLIRERCEDPGSGDCESRVASARQNYVDAGVTGYWTVPGATTADWLECGQCTDCFNPAFDFRPGTTAQYALALSDDAGAGRFQLGLIGSSDNHAARPGTGYKELARLAMTEANGPREARLSRLVRSDERAPGPDSIPFDPVENPLGLNELRDMERQASFFMTGGLVAAHAAGRDRNAIWDALHAREVYATSGDRILLWFDLLRGDGRDVPMGQQVPIEGTPRFRASAVGAFAQEPGCPAHVEASLGAEALSRLCLGECYHPSDQRRRITRIEVVRIRPRVRPDEPVHELVEDPWRSFACPDDPSGCTVEFEDPEAVGLGRDLLYYVRAVQEPTPAVNADPLRCKRDASGRCIEARPCYGDFRTAADEDCLAPNEERAWSSPIFLSGK